MENLTAKEIDTIIEALESWENKDWGSDLMFSLMGPILIGKDSSPEMKVKFENDERIRKEKLEQDKRERKEISLMLKAKLVQIKRQMIVDSANTIINPSTQKDS